MKLVEIFLPVLHRDGTPVPETEFAKVEDTLTEKFGGVTSYRRSPATGQWRDSDSRVEVDDITIVEVIFKDFDGEWWKGYRSHLLERFQQKELLIRVTDVELI